VWICVPFLFLFFLCIKGGWDTLSLVTYLIVRIALRRLYV